MGLIAAFLIGAWCGIWRERNRTVRKQIEKQYRYFGRSAFSAPNNDHRMWN